MFLHDANMSQLKMKLPKTLLLPGMHDLTSFSMESAGRPMREALGFAWQRSMISLKHMSQWTYQLHSLPNG